MTPDEFKRFLQSTYRNGEFEYKAKVLGKILAWGDKWQPNSIKLFKNILIAIKKGEGKPDNNLHWENGKYVSRPGFNNDYMTVFFEPPNPNGKLKYTIYDFEIGSYVMSKANRSV